MSCTTQERNDAFARRINSAYEKLYVKNGLGERRAIVCVVCDEFTQKSHKILPLSWLKNQERIELLRYSWQNLSPSLRKCYQVQAREQMEESDPWYGDDTLDFIERVLLLSPRATYVRDSNNKKRSGFTCCVTCKQMLQCKRLPLNAIKNNYCLGSPPKCLLDLSDIELAYLSPVKHFGYCFTYTGGKILEGSLSFFRIKIKSIVRGVTQLDVLGLRKDIVVLHYGKMTRAQQQRAKEKRTIRIDYVMRAIEWLLRNNTEWQKHDVDLDELRRELHSVKPVFIDDSILLEQENNMTHGSSSNNVEQTETFRMYFPDSALDEESGGQGNIDRFKHLVHTLKSRGYNFDYQCSFSKESVSDFKDNNLVNACLLQFPYGRGGMNECRMNKKGDLKHYVDVDKYISHLSRLSNLECQAESFTLILYNMFMRRLMVRNAGWRVRNKLKASQISRNLSKEEVNQAIHRKNTGQIYTGPGNTFISAVDAVSCSVPHSNGATRKARLQGEAICHQFGTPHFFLTITPDDENAFFILVYTYNEKQFDSFDALNMSDDEIAEKLCYRQKLRIKYPGVCSLYFESVLDIVIRDVIGWDDEEGRSTNLGGLFGAPLAYITAVEEQGRKTLHAHILVWVKGMSEVHENINSNERHESRAAKRKLVSIADKTISTELLAKRFCYNNKFCGRKGPFCHPCVRGKHTSCTPKVVDDQSIRNLRNKRGRRNCGGALAICNKPLCTKIWTGEDLVEDYLTQALKVRNFTNYTGDINRLKSIVLSNQANEDGAVSAKQSVIAEAAYNFHIHTSSCFSTKRKKCEDDEEEECRYRLPKRKRAKTSVCRATDKPIRWYKWNGVSTERHINEVVIKRQAVDAFQNESCKAVSSSKLACNTNLSVVSPGPLAGYTFKYQLKDTQDDDTKEYERISEVTERTLEKRKHDTDKPEALRRVLAASFAHQKKGIIGSALAAYITRNGSRFRMSHSSIWIPIKDTYNLLVGRTVSAGLRQTDDDESFFLCGAMDYLCRPKELENVNLKDFFTKYRVVPQTKESSEHFLQFSNTTEFVHPSYNQKSGRFRQGVKRREETEHLLAKVYQRHFVDAENFKGNILDYDTPTNTHMEAYSRQVLLLLCPYRSLADIYTNNSFTLTLRSKVSSGLIHERSQKWLQNVQDTAHNNWKVVGLKDDLQRHTKLKGKHEFDTLLFPDACEEDALETRQETDFSHIEDVLEELDRGTDLTQDTQLPQELDSRQVKDIGSNMAGYSALSRRTVEEPDSNFITRAEALPTITSRSNNSSELVYHRNPRIKDIANLLMSRTTRKTRSFEDITGKSARVDVYEANGSTRSIIDWARKADVDKYQRRAFEIMTATFVLTYCRSKDTENSVEAEDKIRVHKERRKLLKLAGFNRRQNSQLVALMHGPGGSGKSTCIDLMTLYAKEYCNQFNDSAYAFTPQTIVITALTGVAAANLHGDTVHGRLYLNRTKAFDPEQIEIWAQTRMVIIDEVSFCDKRVMNRIHSHLSKLRQDPRPFGGLNIVFAGDFRQLEPVGVGSKPLYEENCPAFRDKVNCFLELKGMHRFSTDKKYGELLNRMRDGTVTKEDIDMINTRVVRDSTHLPPDLRYATFTNKDRDSINAALFEMRSKETMTKYGSTDDSIMIFADNLKIRVRPKIYKKFRNARHFWNSCSESRLRQASMDSRMDPVLKLYKNCPVMLPSNIDVKNGLANGTRALVNKVVLKAGQQTESVFYAGIRIKSVLASQVDYVELRYEKPPADSEFFRVSPQSQLFSAELPIPEALQTEPDERQLARMKATQLPLLVNNATTGHKLQGATIDSLFVHCWRYDKNWAYVVLSRVRTLEGLFLREPIKYDRKKFAVPTKLKIMMRQFRKKTPRELSYDDYRQLIAHN